MTDQQTYAGFWIRCGGAIIDAIIMWIVTAPIMLMIYGRSYFGRQGLAPVGVWDFLATWVLPVAGCLAFWIARSATPGKIVLGMTIVDAATGTKPTTGQFVRRLLGSFLSAAALGLGYLWVAFDDRKQTWHDKIAGTVVLRGV